MAANSSPLQRTFCWFWLSLFMTMVSLNFNLTFAAPCILSSYMALRKLAASSLVIIDGNDEDIEMQPLEISGQTPQIRRRQLSTVQAFRMAFANYYGLGRTNSRR